MFQEVYIIVDALDECSEESGIRRDFIAQLLGCLPHIRLLVTSRDIPAIDACLKPHCRIDICANDEEVRSFIEAQTDLQPLASILANDHKMRKTVIESVADRTNGM